jgi:hypothetical protein
MQLLLDVSLYFSIFTYTVLYCGVLTVFGGYKAHVFLSLPVNLVCMGTAAHICCQHRLYQTGIADTNLVPELHHAGGGCKTVTGCRVQVGGCCFGLSLITCSCLCTWCNVQVLLPCVPGS